MRLIEREKYMNKLIRVMETPDIKVITGIRRSGKSKLLEAFKKYIEKNIENCNIIYINYSLTKFENLKEYHKLYEYIDSHYIKSKTNFLLIDEIQMCEGFENTINSLHAEERFDIYITGSNAFLLSSDLATLFTGRTFQIEVFPFSFKEFMKYYKYNDPDKVFDEYLIHGGMAGSYPYEEENEKYEYIKDVYETLIIRDIKQKYKVKNSEVLEEVNNYLTDNISNLTSSNSITEYLIKNKSFITYKTVNNYIDYLCNAFAFYKIRRFDIKGKKYLKTLNKYYLADHSFRYARLGTTHMDYGRLYENIVAIELLRRGYEVYVGTLYDKEIDFVVQKRDEKMYIQVCANINDEKTLEREVSPLLKIKDAYPKMIITRTRHDDYTYEGIEIKDIANWLAKEE